MSFIIVNEPCKFCGEGFVFCECEGVSLAPTIDECLDDALELERVRVEVLRKLGLEQASILIDELKLNEEETSTWRTLAAMSIWA